MDNYYSKRLVEAIENRNEIENRKVKLDREIFEFNKQLNVDSTKANTDIATTLASYSEMVRKMNDNIEKLFGNDVCFKQEIDNIKKLITQEMDGEVNK